MSDQNEVDEILDRCYGATGVLTIQKDEAIQEAFELAKDVHWFVRMQGSADPGLKQCVEMAERFIQRYGDGE